MLLSTDPLKRSRRTLGGTSYGRPYGGGSFSVATDGHLAFNVTRPDQPGEVAVLGSSGEVHRLTNLNEDLLSNRRLGDVEEIWWESSFDGRSIQGWIVKPPDFDPSRRYPLLLEIHGGPVSNYGDRFLGGDAALCRGRLRRLIRKSAREYELR